MGGSRWEMALPHSTKPSSSLIYEITQGSCCLADLRVCCLPYCCVYALTWAFMSGEETRLPLGQPTPPIHSISPR